MVTIRLQRRGRKKRPIHHIVVADSRSPRDGRIVEDLGRFNNLPVKNEVTLNEERVIYWLKQGAQPSDTVRSIFKKQGILYKMHLIRWGKSEEEIEAALDEWRAKRAEKEEKTPSKKERQRAMLEAEEKEYQKQLKKQAEEAAREKAKEEALAKEQEEAAAKAKIEQEAPSEAQETEAEQADEAQEEAVEAKAEEIEEVDVKTTQSGELAAGAEVDQDEVDAA
ncbi:MAG TPA: 30S ribosomal protein S16, partial [Balneolaceae bacterium]|nr:30S ribosomal protein S16 [Balneolaceae bacterium]